MHVLASSCVFSERIKQACTCPGVVLWTTGPATDRFLKNVSLFPLVLCHCLLNCPLLSFLSFFNSPVHPQTGFIYHIRSLATLLFQPCERVVVYFPSASLSPSWKSGKTSSVCLAQSRFVPPQDLTHPPSSIFFTPLFFFPTSSSS